MTFMKALSIRSPWWAWILYGGKRIENRNWWTSYRGTILIHASKFWKLSDILDDNESAMHMARHAGHSIPDQALEIDRMKSLGGHCVGLVDIVDCVKSHPSPWFVGNYGLVLENPRPITPFPVKGALGLFPVDYASQPEQTGHSP
jgi:ASCH domain